MRSAGLWVGWLGWDGQPMRAAGLRVALGCPARAGVLESSLGVYNRQPLTTPSIGEGLLKKEEARRLVAWWTWTGGLVDLVEMEDLAWPW